jgi:glycosyltransferase involved in cell wall biosynthesis
VRYGVYRTATNPLVWDEAIEQEFRGSVRTVAFLVPTEEIRGRTLLDLHKRGVRRVVYVDRGRVRCVPPSVLAAWRELQSIAGRARRLVVSTRMGPPSVAKCRAILATAGARRIPADPSQPLRIGHFVCSLNSGGAERQVCYAAILQKQAGHDVRILSRLSLVGEDGHFKPMLAPHNIPARRIGSVWSAEFEKAWMRQGLHRRVFRALPRDLAVQVADLVGELLTDPVDILHCYVDDCNIPGAIAAALTGTSGVILSFRNGNPTHFPGLCRPWMLPWYQALLGRPGIVLSSNSEQAARDYEAWLGLPARSVPVVRNAFIPQQRPTLEPTRAWRRRLGIAEDAPLLAGVFRLTPEKRPLYFLECVRRIRQNVPGLRVVLAGVGCLEGAVRKTIVRHGLDDCLLYLGQVPNVPLLLAASDVMLLTSDWEGTPNVVLEAQHFGCVPVVTDAGGSREAFLAGESGILVGLNDLDEACRAVITLLSDPKRRVAMAACGQAFVSRAFSSAALVEGNARLHASALAK